MRAMDEISSKAVADRKASGIDDDDDDDDDDDGGDGGGGDGDDDDDDDDDVLDGISKSDKIS